MFSKKNSLKFASYALPRAMKDDAKEIIGYAIDKSDLGLILVATFELGILAVLNGKNKDDLLKELEVYFPKDHPVKGEWDADRALAEVLKMIEDPGYKLTYPVFMHGTEFQKKVWRAVQEVPPGKTATYLDIAQKIGAPRAMRAVGSSCTRNKLFFIVPCHRIVRNDYKSPGRNTRKNPLTRRDMLLERETNNPGKKIKSKFSR